MATIFPSLIGADLLNLEHTIKLLDPHVQGYHIDIMDNHFVPNLTWGPLFVEAISRVTKRTLWVHLMVDDPLPWLDMLNALPPASIVSFHFESRHSDSARTIARIKERGWKPSIAISPKTKVDVLFSAITTDVRHVLLMSVEPGFSGQGFIKETVDKLKLLVGYRQTSGINFKIGMDGGIDKNNIVQLVEGGVDDLAIASALFKDKDPVKQVEHLQKLIKGIAQKN